MKRFLCIFSILALSFIFLIDSTYAYWLWTPESKKFINPKYAVKDSPKEQYDWAMQSYNAKDYPRAASEFDKLTKHYEYSEYAGKAQYYLGLCYENMGKYYTAFQQYQKAIDNYPHLDNLDEIIARQYNIGNIYISKASPRIMGTDILAPVDRAVEVYKKVVDNAPFGRLADEAQFRLGEALKKGDRFDEAIEAFQKLVDDYPNSKFREQAKYEVAHCAYKASLKPAYDVSPTDKAIKAFQDFAESNKDEKLSQEASKTVQRLKDKAAEKSLLTAQFYEKVKKYKAAIIYYKDIVDRYPESSYVKLADNKIEELTARLEHRYKPKAKPFKIKKAEKRERLKKEKPKKEGGFRFPFMTKKAKKVEPPIEQPIAVPEQPGAVPPTPAAIPAQPVAQETVTEKAGTEARVTTAEEVFGRKPSAGQKAEPAAEEVSKAEVETEEEQGRPLSQAKPVEKVAEPQYENIYGTMEGEI